MNMSYSGSVETDAAYQHALTLVDSNYPGALNFPGGVKRPISRHTYSSVHWVDATQRLVAGGSSTWSGYNERYWQTSAEVWTSVPQDCWTYDPNQGDEGWQWMGSKLVNPAYDTKGVISTYHRMRERLYQPSANLNNNIEMREWNPHTNTFTLLPGSLVGVTVTGYLACADTKRDRVLVLSYYTPDPVRLWSWAPDTGEWTLLSSGQFASFEACVYDEAADAMLIMNGTTLYKYDCVTGTVTSSEAPLPNLLQIGGRFMYDYRRKVSLAIYNDAQTGLRLFAFKGQQ